jgi:hypothetical protein
MASANSAASELFPPGCAVEDICWTLETPFGSRGGAEGLEHASMLSVTNNENQGNTLFPLIDSLHYSATHPWPHGLCGAKIGEANPSSRHIDLDFIAKWH